MRVPINVSIKKEIVETIDNKRGLVTRSRYVEWLISRSLQEAESTLAVSMKIGPEAAPNDGSSESPLGLCTDSQRS